MLLEIEEKFVSTLKPVTECKDVEVIKAFMVLVQSSLESAPDSSIVAQFSETCGWGKGLVSEAMIAIVKLFQEALREKISTKDFIDSLLLLGMDRSVSEHLEDTYRQWFLPKYSVYFQSSHLFPQYRNLQWRNEVIVASNCVKEQMCPLVVMHLSCTSADGSVENHVLQTDPNNLKHMIECLEQASTEMNSLHTKRMMHYLG